MKYNVKKHNLWLNSQL